MAAEKFQVQPVHVTMFARAISDPNPVFDVLATAPEDMSAPPTFVQSSAHFDPDYPLRPKIGAEDWYGSGAGPGVAVPNAGGQLHAEQHYEYLKPLKPGMSLAVTVSPGRTWEKESQAGRTLHFTETVTEYRDEEGELVVVARGVGVRIEDPGGK